MVKSRRNGSFVSSHRPYAVHASKDASTVISRPPMAIRTLLVGTSVGLTTPAFVIAGVFQAWLRVMPRSELGSAIKAITGVLIGGGSLTLVYNYVGPFPQRSF